jgi:hypothetical protein
MKRVNHLIYACVMFDDHRNELVVDPGSVDGSLEILAKPQIPNRCLEHSL